MFKIFKTRNVINAQVVEVKTNKIMKRTLREANKQIRKDKLKNRHALGMFLPTIDRKYESIRASVKLTTSLVNYKGILANRRAETGELIAFYEDDMAELRNLYRVVRRKAEEADRTDDLRQDGMAPPNIEKLRTAFDKLTDEDESMINNSTMSRSSRGDTDARN
jgi:hypothetical protein